MKRLDCEYHLEPGKGYFWTAHGEWADEVDLGPAVLAALQQLEYEDEEAYGRRLFELLLPAGSRLLEGYRTTVGLAARSGLRFCLHLHSSLPPGPRGLAWELLRDPQGDVVLARSAWITFVLCPHLSGIAPAPAPVAFRPRILVAVADGHNLEEAYHQAPLENHRKALAEDFQRLRWRVSCDFLQGPVTRAALRDRLREGRYDVLHLVAHGLPPEYGEPSVLLQGEHGNVQFISPQDLAEDLSDCRDLRLVVLAVCHGAPLLADLLLRRGIPAVVAMRREISVAAAEVFVRAFYPSLAATGEVDAAANEARLRLVQDQRTRRHWSDPILLWTRQPWRKVRFPQAAALAAATTLCLGVLTGWAAHEPGPAPPCPEPRPCPVKDCPVCPSRPAPVLQVTRIAGREVVPGQELEVGPAGDVEGTLFVPPDPYPIRAESRAEGFFDERKDRSSKSDWLLHGLRFRGPESRGETRATVTVEAGVPPVSQTVKVRVPAPRAAITHVCGQPVDTASASCRPLVIRGTVENALEREEQVWVELRRPGDENNPRCLYRPVDGTEWTVEDPWSGGEPRGSFQIRAGLVARPPGGRSCPEGMEPLDSRSIPARREAR